MKRIDFEHGTVTGNILGAALPMLVAQILSLLYNIVDRVYIARIPEVGTAALGAVGLCFPLIVIITAFSNLFGSGGAPLFSIERGKNDQKKAERIMNTSYSMVCVCAVILMVIGFLFARPLLSLFGASADAMVYAYPYMMIYLIGTLPSMVATGMLEVLAIRVVLSISGLPLFGSTSSENSSSTCVISFPRSPQPI